MTESGRDAGVSADLEARATGTSSVTPVKYVAIDMRTDEVVLAEDTPQQLQDEIRTRGLVNVATTRAPSPDEPLFVGGH